MMRMLSDSDKDLLVDLLDDLIRRAVPGVSTVDKYGGTLYTLRPAEKEGQFCGIFSFAQHVQLAFSNGVALNDPCGLLSGSGKLRRHINFAHPDGLDEEPVRSLLRQAAVR